MKNLLLSLAQITCVILFFSSCEDKVIIPQDIRPSEISHVIAPETAIQSMCEFLGDMEFNNSRSGITIEDIKEIVPIGSNPSSRGTYNDTLIYVVNFADSAGFAILPADDRVSSPVIVYVPSRNISTTRPTPTTGQISSLNREYPASTPGIYTVPHYPHEVFMNPNTIDMYFEDKDEILVGNFNPNGAIVKNPNASMDTPDQLVIEQSKRYVQFQTAATSGFGAIDADGSGNPNPPQNNDTILKIVPAAWQTVNNTSNILTKTYWWGQSDYKSDSSNIDNMFNYYHPMRRFIILGSKKKAPAGCVPLAIAKLMTHYHYPENLEYDGQIINWGILYVGNKDESFKKTASAATHYIADSCNSWYFYEGTFTFPSNAAKFMSKNGFKNARTKRYDENRIVSMINKTMPVIIYGAPRFNIFKSHAWIIDGYKEKKRILNYYYSVRSNVIRHETKIEFVRMFHCDFGWYKDMNGYYVAGFFESNHPYSERDYSDDQDRIFIYNTLLGFIEYDDIRC